VGKQACTIKVYLCDFSKALTLRILLLCSIKRSQQPLKKLILNMDNLGVFIDNIEGLTFGPKLAKAVATFVSDNNFSDKQSKCYFLKWTTILKHTNNDDLIIVAILIFNSTLRTAFKIQLEIVEVNILLLEIKLTFFFFT
jgi:hypothetical protein